MNEKCVFYLVWFLYRCAATAEIVVVVVVVISIIIIIVVVVVVAVFSQDRGNIHQKFLTKARKTPEKMLPTATTTAAAITTST